MLQTRSIVEVLPGVVLATGITGMASFANLAEERFLGTELFGGLVIAIGLGTVFRTFFGLPNVFRSGVSFSSKFLLELAIVLLGASVGLGTLENAGWPMIAMVGLIVSLSLTVSYGICRALGLHDELATLVACGNSICGNSAIVAAAPAIEASADDIASSIAFTAALGIVVVLIFPWTFPFSRLSEWQYGVVAGMTVYAVPQVLAATAPVGAVSVQIGTLVKLIRVLMLGPVVVLLRLRHRGHAPAPLAVTRLVPWFIIGFFLMMLLRSSGVIPSAVLSSVQMASSVLTVVSMAALGLSVNMRTVFASGGRVLLAGILSALALLTMSLVGLTFLPVAIH